MAQSIRYYDEVLTQSARNYAYTGDPNWEARYWAADPELGKIINEAISVGDDTEREFFANVERANNALIAMEYQSIDLVHEGRRADAIRILDSEAYSNNKAIFRQGLESYLATRGEER